ncbi:MAG TPA: SGNH/GDSL hydrolase family protein [Gemmatimonadales bacterium]|nr:SGNH/GDSL hydrolase family protein [Gemmatimonadales bacterium]
MTAVLGADRWKLTAVVLQLALVVFVAAWFQVESPAFATRVVPLAAVAFLLHHVLPPPHRLPFFNAVSLAAVVMVLGWVNALWLVGIVVGMAALVHLPASWPVRVLALMTAGLTLGFLRGNLDWTPFSPAIWPVLGSVLMFRLIVYAYDVRHASGPMPRSWSLAYFLMLPNVVFPLFPVIDFATFRRTYYDREPFAIYQRGLAWILRGLVHLLLYRAVYQNLTLAPEEVNSGARLVQYMVTTFLLYLRVSGTFHLVVGLLHLFGFRLPETHRFFYLSTSFTDFWRRINIYWKDFMMKVVFYPVYFPLRRRTSDTAALVLATMAVFLVTWLTHSYQWFWILGSWLLSWTDGLFWAGLGGLLIVNSLWEAKRGRHRTLPGTRRQGLADSVIAGFKAAAVFTTICGLWSMWGLPSLGDWFDLLSVPQFTVSDWAVVLGVPAVVALVAFVADFTGRRQGDVDGVARASDMAFYRPAVLTIAGLLVLAVAPSPWVVGRFGVRTREFAREMRLPELNMRDAERLTRGYYENLQGVSLQNSQLWELYAQRPAEGQDIWQSGVLQERSDFLARELKPLVGVFQRGRSFRTNRWGMRDRDYELAKPPGTYRVALLGQSYVAGDGVSDGETFDELVEDRIAEEDSAGARRVQILNFGVGSYSQLQQLLLLHDRVFEFQPDVVMVVGNPGDAQRLAIHLVQQVRRGVAPPWPVVQDVLTRAGVTRSVRETEALSRLAPFRDELLAWTLREIAAACRLRDVRPVWVYLSLPERGPAPAVIEAMRDTALAAGFHVLDWSDVYDGHDWATLRASPWDFHPNARGHELIAERLYHHLVADTTLGLLSAAQRPETP